jgi:hypothetical protein
VPDLRVAVEHRRDEQARAAAVVVDLRADQVVGVLLDDQPLHLEAAGHDRGELRLDLEVAVGRGLPQARDRVHVAPDVVRAARGQRHVRRTA